MASTKPDEPPEPPYEDYPFDTFWEYDDEDDEWVAMGVDDRDNDFALDTGSPEPQEGVCNAPVRDYQRRYGEMRYCTRIPAKEFPGYESDYCKTHMSMEPLEEHWKELFKHGHFAETYVHFSKHLSPTKFLFAIEMVGGLFERSRFDFDTNDVPITLDTSDSELIEEDAVRLELPVPTTQTYNFEADQLWQAALSEVEMRNMREVVFKENMEAKTYAATADVDGEITDSKTERAEHHLHLPISRLTKDIKEHLKNGGVAIDDEENDGMALFQKTDYNLTVEPDEGSEAKPVEEVGEEFSEQLGDDSGEVVIEVDEP